MPTNQTSKPRLAPFPSRTIFTRLFVGSMTMVICMMALTALFIGYQAKAMLNEKTETQLREASRSALQEVNDRVHSIENALQSFATVYKHSPLSNSQVFDIFSDMAALNANISELQLATRDGRYLTFPGSPLDAGYDPRKTDWYQGAVSAQAAYISDVFRFSDTEFPKIAVSLALRSPDDEVVGAVVAFVSVPKLSAFVQQVKLGETGYAMIVDRLGKLVAHPDQTYALQRPALDHMPVVRSVAAGQSGTAILNQNGADYLVAYRYDEKLKWGIVVLQAVAEVEQDVRAMRLTIFAVSLIGLAALAALLFLYVRRIITPIKEVQTKLAAFSEGDLFQTMQVNTRDEIRQLADSFNRMSGQIRTIIGKIQRVIADVKHVAEHVGKGSRHSHAMQTEVVGVTERLSAEMDRQQAQIENIRTIVDRITDEISRITGSIQTAIEHNGEARAQTARAADSIGHLKANMQKISDDMRASLEAMSSLRQNMDDVNEILNLIAGISKRTKLLSLNARIEASRAGQAGLGFGVVAEEIRLLSEQTEDATERIQQVIASGQARMDLVTERMTVTDHATVDGLQTLHEAADVFSRIVAVSEILTEQFAVIGRLSRSISRQSQDIKEGVDALSHSAQAVTAGAQQAVAATQESVSLSEQFLHDSERLAAIVDDLEQEIRFFRTAAAHVPDAADGSIVRPLPASS